MTTPIELKENLLKQHAETVETLRKIEGAIYACEMLQEKETVEETTNDE